MIIKHKGGFMKKIKEWFLIFRDPCKKCLIGPICRDKNCDAFKKYINFKEFYSAWLFLIFLIIIMLFATITICLGLFQWYQILV